MAERDRIEGNPLFPIFVKLDQIKTLIVGGGNVGLEKLEALLKNDPKANIVLVATRIKSEIVELAEKHPRITLINRRFRRRDLKGIDMAILATDDRKLHEKICELARKRHRPA